MLPPLSLWVCLFPCLSLSAAFLSLLSVSPCASLPFSLSVSPFNCQPQNLPPSLRCVFLSLTIYFRPLSGSPPCASVSGNLPPRPLCILAARPNLRAWGSSLSGPARSSAGPFVHCSLPSLPTLRALLSLPPSQAPKLGSPKCGRTWPRLWGSGTRRPRMGVRAGTPPHNPWGHWGDNPHHHFHHPTVPDPCCSQLHWAACSTGKVKFKARVGLTPVALAK